MAGVAHSALAHFAFLLAGGLRECAWDRKERQKPVWGRGTQGGSYGLSHLPLGLSSSSKCSSQTSNTFSNLHFLRSPSASTYPKRDFQLLSRVSSLPRPSKEWTSSQRRQRMAHLALSVSGLSWTDCWVWVAHFRAPLGSTVSILHSGQLLGFWWATLRLIPNPGVCGGRRERLALESGSLIPILVTESSISAETVEVTSVSLAASFSSIKWDKYPALPTYQKSMDGKPS